MFLRNGFKFAVFDSKQVSLSDYVNLEQWCRIISISLDLQIQRYEGASTIYGPHTLEAFIQEFNKLADALAKVQYSNCIVCFQLLSSNILAFNLNLIHLSITGNTSPQGTHPSQSVGQTADIPPPSSV